MPLASSQSQFKARQLSHLEASLFRVPKPLGGVCLPSSSRNSVRQGDEGSSTDMIHAGLSWECATRRQASCLTSVAMKVTVNVCYVGDKAPRVAFGAHGAQATLGEGGRLSLSTKPSDTVLRLKQRVAMVEPVPFPDQAGYGRHLSGALGAATGGEGLGGAPEAVPKGSCVWLRRLEQLELDGKPLTFVVKATPAILTKQLVELLQAGVDVLGTSDQARPVSANELSMMYSHKHGATLGRKACVLMRHAQFQRVRLCLCFRGIAFMLL